MNEGRSPSLIVPDKYRFSSISRELKIGISSEIGSTRKEIDYHFN